MSGVVVEANHIGDSATYVIRSRARARGLDVRTLRRDVAFPQRAAGVIYVREVYAATGKSSRARGPASETEAGRVHVVGELPDLELEWTTYEPGTAKSPNRYDAANYLLTELLELDRDVRASGRRAAAGDAARATDELNAYLERAGARRVL